MITQQIYGEALISGGCTFNFRTHKFEWRGYALSPYPYAEAKRQLTELNIQFMISEHYALLKKPNHMLGIWYNADDEEWYYDVTIVVQSERQALRLSKLHKQIAYFDLKNGKEIRL